MSLSFDHVHLSAPDQAAAAGWYVRHLGARPGASPERVLVGERQWLIFYKADHARPSAGGVINSIGFRTPDLDATVQRLIADGASAAIPSSNLSGFGRAAMVDDPHGVRLTLIESNQIDRITFDHVCLRVPDPDATLAWYLDVFGGRRNRYSDALDAVQYEHMWLIAERGDAEPSHGRAIDHLSWRAPHLDTTATAIRARSVVFTMEPRQFNPTTRISFIDGPDNVRIEIVERR
jgi:catechol 2,3-dioxygenase-like lactoylglutathione lyase family enzyme